MTPNDERISSMAFLASCSVFHAPCCQKKKKKGSFVLDEKDYLNLSNRPLSLQLQYLENQEIPADFQQHVTYPYAESYINDIFSFHEARLRHQPNAVEDLQDGLLQASPLMVMKSVWPCFFRRDLLRGPLLFSFIDVHQFNIFADEDWNITCLVDLEWARSRPVGMIRAFYWLSNQSMYKVK